MRLCRDSSIRRHLEMDSRSFVRSHVHIDLRRPRTITFRTLGSFIDGTRRRHRRLHVWGLSFPFQSPALGMSTTPYRRNWIPGSCVPRDVRCPRSTAHKAALMHSRLMLSVRTLPVLLSVFRFYASLLFSGVVQLDVESTCLFAFIASRTLDGIMYSLLFRVLNFLNTKNTE